MSAPQAPSNSTDESARYTSGAMLIAGSALLFSAKAVFIKLAYRHGIDPVSLMTLRMLFSFPVYLAIGLYTLRGGRHSQLDIRTLLQVGLLGLTGYYAASFLDLSGLQYITANLERLILYVYPSLVLLISALLLKRPIRGGEIACLVGAYCGIALVFGTDLELYDQETVRLTATVELPAVLWGGLLVLGSAVTFACYMVGSEHMMRRLSPTLFTSLAMMASTLAISIHFLLTQPLVKLLGQPPEIYGLAFAIAILSTVVPSYMMAAGIHRISASRASIIGSVGPMSTMVMGYWFLGETVTPVHILGLSVVVFSSLVLSRLRG
jgi:drug/metabolite transporter (DMT)-like permease